MKALWLRWLVATLGVVALFLAGAYGTYRFARSTTTQLFGRILSRVDTRQPVVALTFDDGPTAAYADEVLSTLAARHVRATFFVNGAPLQEVPEVARRLVAAGHELGNHTFSHERMVLRSQRFISSEIGRTDTLIRATGQQGEIYFRPPFGWKLVGLPWFLWRNGRTTITWDIDADAAWKRLDGPQLAAACVERVRPGSIILMHVWFPARASSRVALPLILDRLHERGYRFVTVRELLALQRLENPDSLRAHAGG